MARKTPTYLEIHKLKMSWDKSKPLINFYDLCDKDVALISKEMFATIGKNKDRDPYEIYSEVFLKWGIECPHPLARRKYSKNERWYVCSCCSIVCINMSSQNKVESDEKKKKEG